MKKVKHINYYTAHNVANDIVKNIIEDGNVRDSDEFNEFLGRNQYAQQLIERLSSEERAEILQNELLSHDKEEEVAQLIQKIRKEKRKQALRRKIIYACSSAASLFILFFVVSEFLTPSKNIIVLENSHKNEFKTPTLILENNEQLSLNENRNTNVSNKNFTIEKQNGLTLKYQSTNDTIVKYNTLIIPAGFTYKVILADGTEVHLNAGSTLKYPVNFNDNSREVELEGEAYFKVTKSSIPFIVKSKDQKVQVYGTEFNIYNGYGISETTLAEGSIGITTKGGEEVMMTPNQLYKFNSHNGETKLTNVDIYEHIAWNSNQFVYQDQTLSRIFYDLSVWYGVRFEIPSKNQDVEATIVLNRDSKIDEIIPFIEQLINMKIINNGKGVYIIE